MIAMPIIECLPDASAPHRGVMTDGVIALPLRVLSAELTVTGMHAAWRIAQTFVNAGKQAIEAVYIHPLPARAAVHACTVTLGGRTISAQLKERGAARAEYQQAVANGQRAALLEEDRSEAFTLSVGNIQPGESATVVVELVGPVAVEGGWATVRLPLTIAPRYTPGSALGGDVGLGTAPDTDQSPDASRISPPVLLPGCPWPVSLSIGIAIDAGGLPLRDLGCSYPTRAVEAGGWAVEPGQRADRDCLIRWRIVSDRLAASAVAAAAPGGGAVIAVTIVPPTPVAAPRPRDVVVLLDRSGSMQGWKMVAARRAAARLVDALDADDRFAVLAFDDGIEEGPGQERGLVAATDRARFAAVSFLAGVGANGGTEMGPAFTRAGKLLGGDVERDRILVLITDGQVSNEDALLKAHAKLLARSRVLALGIDQAVNEGLLARLAAPWGGWHVCVESEEWLDEVLAIAVQRVAPPALTAVRVTGAGLDAAALAPQPMPDCFVARPLTLWVPASSVPAEVTVSGVQPDGSPWSQTIPVVSGGSQAVARCWARARVRDLEDRYAVAGSQELAQAIIACSLANGVLSRFTAFVAVDARTTDGGKPQSVVQPLPLPAGWGMGAEEERAVGGFGGAVPVAACAAPMAPAPAGPPAKDAAKKLASGFAQRSSRRSIVPAAPPSSFGLREKSSGSAFAEPEPPLPPDARKLHELRDRLAALVADPVATALLLRKDETRTRLIELCDYLAGDAQSVDAVRELRAAIQRCAPPATMAAVAGERATVLAGLDALMPRVPLVGKVVGGAPPSAKSARGWAFWK